MKRRFFPELTGLANAIRHNAAAQPARLSSAKDVPDIMDKRAAKLARRAERAKKGGQIK